MGQTFATLSHYETRAREILAEQQLEQLFSAPGDRMWRTNQANIAGYQGWSLRPRVLTGITERTLETTVLGQRVSFPVMVAPSSSHQRVCAEGELATARAAGGAGTLMVLSTGSNFSVEEVAAAATGPLWFQLYILKNRDLTVGLIRRAEEAGYRAIVLTVDNVAGRLSAAQRRNLYKSWNVEAPYPTLEPGRELRNFAALPDGLRPTSLIDAIDPEISWRDVEWLRRTTTIPIVVKGIQTGEDARLCVESGAEALIVSNHGGVPLELEGVRATVEALPEVVDAVAGRIEVYHDGGIRCGRDVFKSLALGARAVLTGRPVQWGLAVDGEAGVVGVLDILRRELDSCMGVCGAADVKKIDRNLLALTLTRAAPI